MRYVLFLLLLATWTSEAQSQSRLDLWDQCRANDPDLRISGCSALIDQRQETVRDTALARYNRGLAFSQKGSLVQSLVDYTEAIALRPDYQAAYFNRGNSLRRMGSYSGAIADYTNAIALAPNNPAPYGNRGYAYELQGDRERAIADYRVTLKLDPGNEVIKKALGRLGAEP